MTVSFPRLVYVVGDFGVYDYTDGEEFIYSNDIMDEGEDEFDNFEFTQSVNPRHREYVWCETRRYWRHIPNHNVKPKAHK